MSTLLINEPPLQILPSLARLIGTNEAIILQQIHYWVSSKHNKNFFDGRHWVWNTYEQWKKQFCFMGERTIRRAIANLEEKRIVISVLKGGFQKVKYYTIDYSRLQEVVAETLEKSLETQGSNLSGQDGHVDLPPETCGIQDHSASQEDNCDRAPGVCLGENPGILRPLSSGQSSQLDLAKQAVLTGQNDQLNLAKMASSPTEITSKITHHPPQTPPSLVGLEKNDDDEFKKMILIWNEVVQSKVNPDQTMVLTNKRKKTLQTFRQMIVESQGISWEDYCRKISATRFLLGESRTGFKVNLDWALIPEKAFRVLEGAFYDKAAEKAPEEAKSFTKAELLEELKASFPVGCLVSEWEKVLNALMDRLDLPVIRSWFKNVGLMNLVGDMAVISVDTQFKRNWIQNHYQQVLEQAVMAAYPHIKRIDLQGRN